jgi:trk system potassium uptake protein TrkH
MIILALFQIGGLGYMIIITLVVLGIGGRLSISGQTLLRQSITRPTSVDMIRFAKIILLFTIVFELAGTIFLGLSWMRFFPCGKAFYLAAFHSVSAFCTAGFSLFPDSLKAYNECFSINLIISILALGGGAGFFCLYELFVLLPEKRFMKQAIRLSTHTKIVLSSTALLILIGAGIIWISGSGAMISIFQAVSASTTTGFNTIEIGNMNKSSLWIILFLMFVGASPGGSGGGIKTVSFVLLLVFLRSYISGRNDVFIFKNRSSSSGYSFPGSLRSGNSGTFYRDNPGPELCRKSGDHSFNVYRTCRAPCHSIFSCGAPKTGFIYLSGSGYSRKLRD